MNNLCHLRRDRIRKNYMLGIPWIKSPDDLLSAGQYPNSVLSCHIMLQLLLLFRLSTRSFVSVTQVRPQVHSQPARSLPAHCF